MSFIYPQALPDSPVALVKKVVKDNWSTILPEIPFESVDFDKWYTGRDISIRFKEQFFTVFQGERKEDLGQFTNIITDIYNIAKHYISTIDIHVFVRDFNLTNQTDIIPPDTNLILGRLDDFFEKNPRILWESDGISNVYPSGQQTNIPFDEPDVYHSIQTVTAEYTLIDKPLPDYTRS